MFNRRGLLLAGGAIALTAGLARAQSARLFVVATFTILADLVRQVGGEGVEVSSLVGPNGDVHAYAPSPADSRKLAAARLIVENGLNLEGWISRLAKASASKARIVVASAGVSPREEHGDHDHAHGGTDPHAWQNVANAKIYVANIRDGLIAANPSGKAEYAARARAYLEKLDALDAYVRAAVAKIPADRRRIVTTHDAFGYFGQAYAIELAAPAGVSTEAAVSARDVGKIIAQIKKDKFPAVFLENVSDPRLIDQIARETGAKIGGTLYSDSLSGPDGAAGTYIDMVRHNISELTKALAP
ncbi:MAG: zinc ABC transporter substrate-binding protein [Rhodoblastus sp.]|nr:zinc ABC transporter substrate-binding protein [Rhodoblastus sp.]MCC0000737.1 zinc ABC transporter substrate-binding protein [Methylobacteriaceae bacterium]MCC0002803.1 zinc ABC transporter substrate-binding protein [Methylobacteriaceae bacterium]